MLSGRERDSDGPSFTVFVAFSTPLVILFDMCVRAIRLNVLKGNFISFYRCSGILLQIFFFSSRVGSATSDKLPQVMSFESVSVGSEDYKFWR